MANNPSFFGDSSTSKIHDTRLIVWKKALGQLQTNKGGSASSENDPKIRDTLRQTKQKFLRATQ